MKRIFLSAALALAIAFLGLACAGGETPNAEAIDAAERAELPEDLTAREAEIYRQGYAMGYYAALHPEDSLDEYVLNTNTHRFHYPSCQSAAAIAPKNRRLFHGTREEAIDAGYQPCGVCKP